ncbi:hypothetical protein [Methyloversatilis discipulorum]|uniref:hypothetical protein n=1 Tax=Methyloversatilis discipulorum TaxID=1119528 RepID=UPI0012FBEBB5|nr:hypothetical protein [Methyloversatilis discipulorum]
MHRITRVPSSGKATGKRSLGRSGEVHDTLRGSSGGPPQGAIKFSSKTVPPCRNMHLQGQTLSGFVHQTAGKKGRKTASPIRLKRRLFSACLKSDMPTEAEMDLLTPRHGAGRHLPYRSGKSIDAAAPARDVFRMEACNADH